MSLRQRIGRAFVLVALLLAGLFGVLVYQMFTRQQQAYLTELLQQELANTAALMDNPVVGASLVSTERGGRILQFVAADETVLLPRGTSAPLPRTPRPQLASVEDRLYLVHHIAWGGGTTIRLGVDVTDPYMARRLLLRNLLVAGAFVVLAAALLGLTLTRRYLAPLAVLVSQTRRVDPAYPKSVRYMGPTDEVAELAEALNAALASIRTRREAERGFLAEVAHELAAPLTVISGQFDALERLLPAHPQLTAARLAAQELLYTSQDLLGLARGELERPLESTVVSLEDVLRRISCEYSGVRLDYQTSGRVVGDANRLMQVVRNLVRNAIQACGSADQVRLQLSEDDREVTLRVFDSGPGISASQQAAIFERFCGGGRGVGVGLSIARSIVEQHQGRLEVTSQLGVGSCFTLRLPSLASRLEPSPAVTTRPEAA